MGCVVSGKLTNHSEVNGLLTAVRQISGAISVRGEVSGSLAAQNQRLSGELATSLGVEGTLSIPDVFYIDVPTFDGNYEVTPLPFVETILETSGKKMGDNVTVLEIPYYETSNEHGGYTVIIG